MKTSIFLIAISFVFSLFVISCEKEEPLSARKDLAGAQDFDININPKDTLGGIGGGTGGGAGGGGSTITEFFTANVGGTGSSFDTYSYTDNGSSVIFSGTNSSNQAKISFSIIGSLNSNQTLDLNGFPNSASYRRTNAVQMISNSGTLYIDTLANDFIRGTFFFTAENQNNSLDTINITSGAFQFEI